MPARLAIAMPSFNRAPMLDAILRELVPLCTELGIPIFVSDNGSRDDTPEVCRRWAERTPLFRSQRHPESIHLARSVMSAISMSDAEYTWFSGDDDWLLPSGVRAVHALLAERDPSAIVVRTLEVPSANFAALDQPLGPQLEPVVAAKQPTSGVREWTDAALFFAAKTYALPAPSVIYRTATTLAIDWEKYVETYHPHIGALFEALALEQAERGRIDIPELLQTCSVSLTVHHDRGKQNWTDLFRYLAVEGFPKWFAMLPALYQPHMAEALAYHRHIFRAALGDAK